MKKESPNLQDQALFVAMIIRNELDYADQPLSDEQSRLVRDAVYTALYAKDQAARGKIGARIFVEYNSRLPSYWDPPQLTEDYQESVALVEKDAYELEPALELEISSR